MKRPRWLVRFVLPLVVLALGAAGFQVLVRSKRDAKRRPKPDRTPLVDVIRVQPTSATARVTGQGTVVPARRVVLSPEVAGRVAWAHPRLVPGGLVPGGAAIVRIDAREYRLAVQQLEANAARAEVELALERGRSDVATSEWKALAPVDATDESRTLALREPQRKAAEATLASARAALERARLNVARTTVAAPFDALVLEESVETGQVVSPQSRLATLVGTARYWVEVAVPTPQLALIDLPTGGSQGSAARVTLQAGARTSTWRGHVVRLLGEVDPAGRMARLVVEVPRPHETGAEGAPRLPLLLNAFVDVEIEGRSLDGVYEVPRIAIHEGDRVWLADAEDRLALRTLEVAWRTPASVVAHGGLEPGDRIVTSPVPGAVAGMALKVSGSLPRREAGTGPPRARQATEAR